MDKEKIKNELILPRFEKNEELVGFFFAHSPPSIGWFFLINGFASLLSRYYYIAITNHGMHLHEIGLFGVGKPKTYDFFSWDKVVEIKIGKRFLQTPLEIIFSNKKKLTLKAQNRGIEKYAKKLDDKTIEFLLLKSKKNKESVFKQD